MELYHDDPESCGKGIKDVTISSDKLVTENPITEEFYNIPLNRKKKKIPFTFTLVQTNANKNEETCPIDSHCIQDAINDDCEANLAPSKRKCEISNSKDSHISDNFPHVLDLCEELDDLELDMKFEGTKKKKKKSSKSVLEKGDSFEIRSSEKKIPVIENLLSSVDADYTYDYLLARLFRIAKQERPSIVTASSKLIMKPPLIFRVGSKKTSFANFIDIGRILHRPPNHLMSFLLAELGTSGSLDGNNHLIVKGRFQQKQIENVIRRYIKEYVRCFTCNSMSTVMQKETRLNFLMCENCESRRSVASIKTGFQALTSKRAAMRAKAVN